ncbi:MAG: tetratricopeptide repeat protein [Candidatus Acidiferrales bacterium]
MKLFLILLAFLGFYVDCAPGKSPSGAHSQLSPQGGAFQKGLTALKENRLEQALEELTIAEREQPDNAQVRNFRGIVLGQMGKDAEAAGEYLESIRLDPLLENAYRNLGFLRWTEHQLAPAREALEHAVKLSPGDSFAHYYLGRVELDSRRYEEAFHELAISHQPLPADAGFLIQAATGYISLGRPVDARQSLAQLLKLPVSDAQSIQVASLLLAVHENDLAIGLIQKLSVRYSSAPATWAQFDLALAYLLSGNYETAIAKAQICIRAAPQGDLSSDVSARAWSLMGIAYAHLKQKEQSISALRQAAMLAPVEEEHWLNLTRELMELNRYSEAITAAQSGLTALPNSYALHLRLGAAYLAAGRYAESESVFRDLVTAGDPLPTGYLGLAQVLLRTGRAGEAAIELAAAEKKLGPSFLLSYFRGLALDRAGKPSEALAAFQDAVRLNPGSAEAHLNLGKTDFTLGHLKEAISELREANRLDPENKQATRLLSQAYRRAGDAQNAAKFAEASAEAPAAPGGDDLLGDFFVPAWQPPPAAAEK